MIDRKFEEKIESRDFRKFRRRDSESDRFQILFQIQNFEMIFRQFLTFEIFEKKNRKNDSFHPSVAT